MAFRSGSAWALWVAPIACNLVADLDGYTVVPAVGAGGASTAASVGGMGGSSTCTEPNQCPDDVECRDPVCNAGVCEHADSPAGAPCATNGGTVCDGAGNCVKEIGVGCAVGPECQSAFCADNVCCDRACNGVCEACDLTPNEGTCQPIAPATDPESECANGVCDGGGACAEGEHAWSLRFGANGDETVGGVAVEASGNVLVVGGFEGTVDFGAGPLTSLGGADYFVLKLDAAGNHVWSKAFGGAGAEDVATGVAVDSAGNVLVAGVYEGAANFGMGPLVNGGNVSIVLFKLDAAGNTLWVKDFVESNDEQRALGVAVDAAGNVLLTGFIKGIVDFGGGPLPDLGNTNVFVAKLSASGAHTWSLTFGDTAEQSATDVATDATGQVVLTGSFKGTLDFGVGAMTAVGGGFDAFVAKLDAAGVPQWSQRYGDAANDYGLAVATDAQGPVLVAGSFSGTSDFGGGPLSTAGSDDGFLVLLDAAGGHQSSQRFGSTGIDAIADIVAGPAWMTTVGHFANAVDFGGGALTSAGGEDAFVAKYAQTGEHLWSRRGGDGAQQRAKAAARAADGIVVAGEFAGSVDFGGGALVSAGGTDAFVVKLTP